jgi:hypothetical protein
MCLVLLVICLTPGQKHQRALSSVNFAEIIDGDRKVSERIVTSEES